LQAARPTSLKKESIQTRNRKMNKLKPSSAGFPDTACPQDKAAVSGQSPFQTVPPFYSYAQQSNYFDSMLPISSASTSYPSPPYVRQLFK
jgi:hypothetical protein